MCMHVHSTARAAFPHLPACPVFALCRVCAAVSRVQARFNAFVRTFKEAGTDDEPKYMRLLQEVRGRRKNASCCAGKTPSSDSELKWKGE